ncbi:MAG: PAS domain S-box protein [Desulfobacterales bacterium]|nr:PAS domain S-box protein [Desulfobacterales bacterium]
MAAFTITLSPAWADEPVKVGVFQNKPIVYFDNEAKGLFVEVLNHVAEKENWKIEYVPCELGDCLNLLETNELQLMTSLGESPERLERFNFSKEPVWTFWGVVYAKDLNVNSILDLEGKRIAVREGNKTTAALQKLLVDFEVAAEFIAFDNYEAAFGAAQSGQLDAIAVNNTYAFSKGADHTSLHRTPIVFNPFSAYFAASKNIENQNFLKIIDQHVKALKSDPDSVYHAFGKKWYGLPETSYWSAKKMGIIGSSLLLVVIVCMAAWRYRSIVRINKDLQLSITEQRQTEKALLASREQFELAMAANRDGLWDWDLETDEVYYSPGYSAMLGYTKNDLPPHIDSWKKLVHPEDINAAFGANNECIENRCDNFAIEFRMRAKDGQWHWILGRGMVAARGSDGRALRLVGTHSDITHRKEVENALRDSEDKMRSIIRAAPIGIGVVSRRIFQEVNDRFCKLVGYSKEELIGERARSLYVSDKEYNQAGKEKYRQIEQLGTGTVQTRMRRKDGRILDILLSSSPLNAEDLLAGVTFTALDITETKRATDGLQESENRFRDITHSMADWIWEVDEDGKYTYVSDTVKTSLGYLPEELIGKTPFELMPGEEAAKISKIFVKISSKLETIVDLENRNITKNGNEICFLTNGVPIIDAQGKFLGYRGVDKDITDQKKLEAEKTEIEARLQQSQKMESIGTLAGGIAHDFNNILFPMSGYTEIMMEDIPVDSPLQDMLKGIHSGIKRAGDLVKQILAFSRHSDHELKPLKMQPVIKEVLKLMRSTLPATITINQDISSHCRLVMADPTQIHQVAMNLMTNAYHAMVDTGGTLRVTLKEVELTGDDLADTVKALGPHVRLLVADTGCGMKQSVIDRIFDPYFTTKAEGKGTGLGLSVVHGIVKEHGGHINLTSHVGKGTVFEVYLPVIQIESDAKEIEKRVHIPKGNEHILLVDDEEAIAKMLEQVLKRLGYRVTSRTSSLEALEAFKHNTDLYDLVVADMTMPNLTGEQMARQIMALKPEMPIILCTGFSEKMSQEKAIATGIKGFLMKPVVKSDLANLIRKVLDNN